MPLGKEVLTKKEEFTDICRIAIVLKGELLLFKNWTNRDWVWLTCVLVALILLSLSIVLSKAEQLIQIFSFLSSGVSIALAFVAIYVSSNQNRDSQSLSQNMSETLARLDEKIHSINEKVDKIDVSAITGGLENSFQQVMKGVNEKIADETKEIDKAEIIEYVESELLSLKELVNHTFEETVKMNSPVFIGQPRRVEGDKYIKLKDLIYNLTKNMGKFYKDNLVTKILKDTHGLYKMEDIMSALIDLRNDGIIISFKDGRLANKFGNYKKES